jgi:copper resistance protein C
MDGSGAIRPPLLRQSMDRGTLITAIATAAAVALTSPAFAQRGGALLDHAVPAVGSAVRSPVRELRLYFTIGVVLFHIQVTGRTGVPIAVGSPVITPLDERIVIVRFKHALPPGTYEVSWRAVSVYSRLTLGRFIFTVC